jgi:hypothetical protein
MIRKAVKAILYLGAAADNLLFTVSVIILPTTIERKKEITLHYDIIKNDLIELSRT